MKLEKIKLADLKPADYNPRTITPEELKRLRSSIKKFGQVENLVVNKDMTLISGHQRLLAMIQLGMEYADCYVMDVDKVTEKALNITLNSKYNQGKFNKMLPFVLSDVKEGLDDTEYEELGLDKLEAIQDELNDIPDAQDVLDEKTITCPKCGEKFNILQ